MTCHVALSIDNAQVNGKLIKKGVTTCNFFFRIINKNLLMTFARVATNSSVQQDKQYTTDGKHFRFLL